MSVSAHLALARTGIVSGRVRSCAAAAVLTRRRRAVSLQRPWANLIVSGHQPVAGCSWSTAFRGLLVIHGGTRWDLAGSALAAELDVPAALTGTSCPGGFLGSVHLRDIHSAAGCCAPWGPATAGRFHWVFGDPCVFTTPKPAPGRRGIFWAGGPKP